MPSVSQTQNAVIQPERTGPPERFLSSMWAILFQKVMSGLPSNAEMNLMIIGRRRATQALGSSPKPNVGKVSSRRRIFS